MIPLFVWCIVLTLAADMPGAAAFFAAALAVTMVVDNKGRRK